MEALLQRLEQQTHSGICFVYKDVYQTFFNCVDLGLFDFAHDNLKELLGFLWGICLGGLITEDERQTLAVELLDKFCELTR